MTFTGSIQQFAANVPKRERAVFTSVAAQLWSSVKLGSALTGAPPMPKAPRQFPRSGSLREGITLSFPDPDTALIYTTSPYAEDVENNAKGHTFVDGGPHGWALSIAAFPRVVESTAQRIAGAK